MYGLLQSGRLLDLIVVLVALEGLLLIGCHLRWRRPGRVLPLLPNLVSGAILMVCVKLALTGGSLTAILALLGLSFVAHLMDLTLRLRTDRSPQASGII